MVSDLHKLSTNFVRESRRKKNCVRKVDINGSQVARNALYKSAGRGKKKDETISFWNLVQLVRTPPDKAEVPSSSLGVPLWACSAGCRHRGEPTRVFGVRFSPCPFLNMLV